MASKLSWTAIKAGLRRRVATIADQRIEESLRSRLPPSVLKYAPYRHGESSYAIVEKPRETGAPADGEIPPEAIRGGFWPTAEVYLESGLRQVVAMLDAVAASGLDLTNAGSARVLDFGCGAGRMLRHLEGRIPAREIWGVDVEADAIRWCKQHFGRPFRFATTTTIPHLPFEDRSFELVCARSVFTHIDDLADAWLLEMRRVLHPEGRLYVTIHDERTVELLAGPYADHPLTKWMQGDPLFETAKNAAVLVVGRDLASQVFYSRDTFRRMAADAGLETQSVGADGYGYQTALVLRRAP